MIYPHVSSRGQVNQAATLCPRTFGGMSSDAHHHAVIRRACFPIHRSVRRGAEGAQWECWSTAADAAANRGRTGCGARETPPMTQDPNPGDDIKAQDGDSCAHQLERGEEGSLCVRENRAACEGRKSNAAWSKPAAISSGSLPGRGHASSNRCLKPSTSAPPHQRRWGVPTSAAGKVCVTPGWPSAETQRPLPRSGSRWVQ